MGYKKIIIFSLLGLINLSWSGRNIQINQGKIKGVYVDPIGLCWHFKKTGKLILEDYYKYKYWIVEDVMEFQVLGRDKLLKPIGKAKIIDLSMGKIVLLGINESDLISKGELLELTVIRSCED